jgi:glycosyltransferase involved in cell wall biosynthesis
VRPLVSVLCMAFNQERYIAACLDGILAQLVSFPVEIIVHDDASTDGTVAVVEDYARRFRGTVRLIAQKENQFSRQRKIRPTMLQHARGAFIANCDGDDVWLDPDKLTKQVEFLLYNPDYVLSFHSAVLIDADGEELGPLSMLSGAAACDHTPAELRSMRWGWMLLGTVVYRNVPVDFPPEYHLAPNGDNFIQVLLGAFGGAKFQPEVGPLGYRQHTGSMWTSRTLPEKTRAQLRSYLQIVSYLLRVGETEAARELTRRQLGGKVRQWLDSP